MALKLTRKDWIYKKPHLGTGLVDEIKKMIVDDYIAPQLEKSPPLGKLRIVVETWR